MKKIVWTFGIIAGLIVSVMMFITMSDGLVNLENGELIGYATMIIALSTIYFGIKSYRDKNLGGIITYGKAFMVGLYITLIASTMYVASWMIISSTYGKDIMDEYYREQIEKIEASGKPQAEIDAKIQEIEDFKEMYKNPIVKVGMTYMEILPVGLLISLICAGLLKNTAIEKVKEDQA